MLLTTCFVGTFHGDLRSYHSERLQSYFHRKEDCICYSGVLLLFTVSVRGIHDHQTVHDVWGGECDG
eukprot:3826709-Amphidinium_carterae.1